MAVGPVSAGSTPVELRPDTRRTHKLLWPGGVLPSLRAMVDGAGSGNSTYYPGGIVASQAVIGVVQDDSGAVVATTAESYIPASIGNGDFERGLDGWTPNGTGVTLGLLTNAPHSGTQSLQVVQTVANTGVNATTLNVVAGSTQTITFWAKRLAAVTTNIYPFVVETAAANGGFVKQTQGVSAVLTDSWAQYTMTVPTDSTTGRIALSIRGTQATAQYAIDRIEINGVGAPFPLVLPIVSPPTLPSGTYYVSLQVGGGAPLARVYGNSMTPQGRNWFPNGVLKNNSNFWATFGNTVSSARDTATMPDSLASWSVEIAANNASGASAGAAAGQTNVIALTPGLKTWRADVVATVAFGLVTQIICYDSNGNVAGSPTVGNFSITTTAASYSGTFVAPESTVRCVVRMRAASGSPATKMYITRVGINDGDDPRYIDGDDRACVWDGTAHASASRGPQGLVNLAPNGTDFSVASWANVGTISKSYVTDPTNPLGASSSILRVTETGGATTGAGVRYDYYRPTTGAALPKSNTAYVMAVLFKAPAGITVQTPLNFRSMGTITAIDGTKASVVATGGWQIGYHIVRTGIYNGAAVNSTGFIIVSAQGRAANATVDTAAILLYEGTQVPTLDMFFDAASANATSTGTTNNSPSILATAGNEIADAYSDGASTTLPFYGSKTMDTMNLAMNQMNATSNSDSFGLADTPSSYKTAPRQGFDVLSPSDSLSRKVTSYRSFADPLFFLDSSLRKTIQARSTSDTTSVADTLSKTYFGYRSLSETLSVIDLFTRKATQARSFADSMAFSDSLNRGVSQNLNFSESLSLADATTSRVFAFRTVSEALGLTDSSVRSTVVRRAIADSLSLSEAATRLLFMARSIEENLPLTDLLVTNRFHGRTVEDFYSIVDSFSSTDSVRRFATEALNLVDSNLVNDILGRSSQESLNLNDILVRTTSTSRSFSEDLAIIDQLLTKLVTSRIVSDSLNIQMTEQFLKMVHVGDAEALQILDVWTRYVYRHFIGLLGGGYSSYESSAEVMDNEPQHVTVFPSGAWADVMTPQTFVEVL